MLLSWCLQGYLKYMIMKVVSYNIRGLGCRVKKRDVKQLVIENKSGMVCLQETKLEMMDSRICLSLWDGDDVDWVAKSVAGNSGGAPNFMGQKLF